MRRDNKVLDSCVMYVVMYVREVVKIDALIKRSDAVQCALDMALDLRNDGEDSAADAVEGVAEWLKGFPAEEAVWEQSEYNGYVVCSNCHDCYIEPEWAEGLKWRFCPHCGRRIRLGVIRDALQAGDPGGH